jgi:hypothetical protein
MTMFKGKAELTDPETGKVVATFTEEGDKMKLVLKKPETLSGTARLAIYSTLENEELIAVAANGSQDTVIREFHGISSLGALTNGAEISLTRSPGGPIGSLLVVLGRGTVHQENH